jgi:hypothetical protein
MEIENNNDEITQAIDARSSEEIARDADANSFAKALGGNDDLEDFEPEAELTPEQQQAALDELGEAAQNKEVATMMAASALEQIETGLQAFAHPKFEMDEKKHKKGTEALAPMIQKYAPAGLKLFGKYKDELMAAWFLSTFIIGSAREIKRLKIEDAIAAKALEESKESGTVTTAEAA